MMLGEFSNFPSSFLQLIVSDMMSNASLIFGLYYNFSQSESHSFCFFPLLSVTSGMSIF